MTLYHQHVCPGLVPPILKGYNATYISAALWDRTSVPGLKDIAMTINNTERKPLSHRDMFDKIIIWEISIVGRSNIH